ncbi:MAG: ABC transporter substrate-binding protein [Nitrospiraceae bacterium]|nr:ABC transporter substrate-binding protein [Nitrospiraceae bacterium]
MLHIRKVVVLVILVMSVFLSAYGASILKVAMLDYGPIGDYGWTYEGHIGVQEMAAALPYVQLVERENASGSDAPQIIREYAKAGFNVIFCHGWGMDTLREIAPQYPDVIFMCGGGHGASPSNMGTYYGRTHGARFLAGMLAAAMSKTNRIGYAAAHPVPRVIAGINAFAQGAAYVNPEAKVYVKWIGEWYDPQKEKEAAFSLIDNGCDVITNDSDSAAVGEAAQERKIYYIAAHGTEKMQQLAPDVYLTGLIWNWAPIFTDIIEAIHNGTWDKQPEEEWWYGLKKNGVFLAPLSDLVPNEVKEKLEGARQALVQGDLVVFPGMTDEELWQMYYLEPNVVGELPAKNAEKAVVIGALCPLTGSLATAGAEISNGLLLAADIINNKYDLDLPLARSRGIASLNGAKIEIVFGNTEGSSSRGRSEAERLLNENKVVALIGCYQSAVTAEASEVAENKGVPFLIPLASAPSLTQRGFKWCFRTTPNDNTFIQNFYEFLQDVQEEKGIKLENLGIVHENSAWGTEFAAYAKQYAGEQGYQVVENVSYPADATNVTNEIQRLKDANPDVVMQASYINDAILYMQTYKDMNFSPDAILADDAGFTEPEFLKKLGDAGNYILTRATWSKDLAEVKPLVGTVNQMFKERYGTNMTGNSARAFTGMLVLADAINRAGATDPKAVREALLETNIPANKLIMPWDGVKFDQETHQNTLGKGIICQIIDQEYYTVWPWDLATKEVIWPMPKWEQRE